MGSKYTDWRDIVAAKQTEVRKKVPVDWMLSSDILDQVTPESILNVLSIPRESGILSVEEIRITEKYDARALVKEIAEKRFTALQVAAAFCKRAAIAQQLTHCLTETFFPEALERARYLDSYLSNEGKVVGPLHGLPVSLKDPFNVKGVESTIGFVSFVGNDLPTENAPLADILLELGAVLYVKTNVPQTLMTAESENNIFGRTLNPHNLSLGAGGSSGGEGALVAMRGSIMGVGTDIAGSVRIPSLSCGTYGFKPSTSRVPYGGQTSSTRAGIPGILPSAGPLATTFQDLLFFMDSVMGIQPWNYDPTALAIPWRQVPKRETLTIGVIGEDPVYPFHPPVTRSLATAVQKLVDAGHTIKHLHEFPSIAQACILAYKYFDLDPSNTTMQYIEKSGEPAIKSLKTSGPIIENHISTLEELLDMNVQREQFIKQWHEIWLQNGLDAVILPGAPKTAGPHDTYGHPPYTLIWNLLDSPACIIPFSKADASIDIADPKIPQYDPNIVDGAPCAIQVAGRRLQDEELLGAAQVIAEVLGRS